MGTPSLPITASRLGSPRRCQIQSSAPRTALAAWGAADCRDSVGSLALETPQPYPFPTWKEGVLGFPSF